MPRHVEVASQLDLPLTSAAIKAADATGAAPDLSPGSPTDQLPLFQSVTDAVLPHPRVGRAFTAFRKLGELLRLQTKSGRSKPDRSAAA